ncbi:MAG TPA: hypothetical protein VJ773_00330 [Gemmatimonadales bacterium]|nr:hypothetical protein [Gemmatimonadales bacterium]
MKLRYGTAALGILLGACTEDTSRRLPVPPSAEEGRGAVDSIFPIEEEIRRFQAGLPDTAGELAGGAASRDTLVRRFMTALERADTAAFAPMAVTRAEFGYLYFPESRFSRPPYRTKPGLLWGRLQDGSSRGINRAFVRLGGRPLGFERSDCPADPVVEGENRVWEGCTVTLRAAGADSARTLRLFGSLLERGGTWKFLSYSNDL